MANKGYITVESNDAPTIKKLFQLINQSGASLTCIGVDSTDNGDGTFSTNYTYEGAMMPAVTGDAPPCAINISSQSPSLVTVTEME